MTEYKPLLHARCVLCNKLFESDISSILRRENANDYRSIIIDGAKRVICPLCGGKQICLRMLFYVDFENRFACWWDPLNNSCISEITDAFGTYFGKDSFYYTAKKYEKWDAFKQAVLNNEKSPVSGGPVSLNIPTSEMRKDYIVNHLHRTQPDRLFDECQAIETALFQSCMILNNENANIAEMVLEGHAIYTTVKTKENTGFNEQRNRRKTDSNIKKDDA